MKKHIFLIDGDQEDVTAFIHTLDKINVSYKCTWAKTCDQASNQLAYLLPDIIFLDVTMPDMNGFDCLTLLKKDSRLQHVPVILHSSSMSDDNEATGKRLGAAACLKKPDNILDLAGIVGKFISDEEAKNTE